jgi:hypothetical protein
MRPIVRLPEMIWPLGSILIELASVPLGSLSGGTSGLPSWLVISLWALT